MRIIVVGTGKGGSGKSTTAWMIALALANKGRRVRAMNADPESQTIADWFEELGPNGYTPPFLVVTWTLPNTLRLQVEAIAASGDVDDLVIDIGSNSNTMLRTALSLAHVHLIPIAPTKPELRRVPATIDVATEAAINNPGLTAMVVLTRVPRAGQGAAREARDVLTARYGPDLVAATEIPQHQDYAQAMGSLDGPFAYAQLLDELDGELDGDEDAA